jgi:hypothetical protein
MSRSLACIHLDVIERNLYLLWCQWWRMTGQISELLLANQPLQLTSWSHKFSWRPMLSSVWPIAMHRRNMTATGPANVWETSDSHSAWCPLVTLFVVIWDLLPYALLRSILSQTCPNVVMWCVHVCDMSARLVYSMPCMHVLVYKLRYIRKVSSILEYKRDI